MRRASLSRQKSQICLESGSLSQPAQYSCRANRHWERAQALADTLSPDHRHRILDHYAQQCCPVLDVFDQSYHWSFMQVACRTGVCHNCETGLISGSVIEYASDLAFRTPVILKPLYEQLSRQAILTILSARPRRTAGGWQSVDLLQPAPGRHCSRSLTTRLKWPPQIPP